ncbi:MAG: CaiB/BaiF CoA transferase family protein [bacterium]
MGPLTGMKVVEFAGIGPPPMCAMLLADMGADVIKVEKVPTGDDSRRFVPPDIDGESAAFMMMNRNKRGVAVDLKNHAGREVAQRLTNQADVVVENYRKGTMERLGLGYEALRERNPGIIYCELSGFGRTGPYAEHGGFDLIAQGMSGLMSITGEKPGGPPVKCGAPVTDITAGILAAMGVLAAYIHRTKTGAGQRVDTSLFEAGIVQTYWQSAITLATGTAPGAMGSAHPLNAPYQAFQTSDGWITVGAANQTNWLRLLEVLGKVYLLEDARFATNEARVRNLDRLAAELEPVFKRRPTAEWLTRLKKAGVPAGPVLDMAAMLAHPQTAARDMVTPVQHTKLGSVQTLGHPVKFSETPVTLERGAPILGEHTREVLLEYGYTEEEIDTLVLDGVVMT